LVLFRSLLVAKRARTGRSPNRVGTVFRKFHYFLGNIEGMQPHLQVRACGADCPRDRINLGALAARKYGDLEAGCGGFPVHQSAKQFQFRSVSEKERAMALCPLREPADQGMHMPAVQTNGRKASYGSRKEVPNPFRQR